MLNRGLIVGIGSPDLDEYDPAISDLLKNWLVDTLNHLEWHSFIRAHWAEQNENHRDYGFIGELPGVGMTIALDRLVSKDELDRIRNAFPATINRIAPSNAPVKLVAWVLDVPAKRIRDASESDGLEEQLGP